MKLFRRSSDRKGPGSSTTAPLKSALVFPSLLLFLTTLLLLTALGWLGFRGVEQEMKANLAA